MHPINCNLAPPVVANIAANDADNWNEIQKLMEMCLQKEDVVDAKDLGRLLRLIESRLTLKYTNNVSTLSAIIDTLLTIYSKKRISIPMKLKSLNVMTTIFKYRKNALNLSVVYDYKPFWDEMYAVCTRNAKDLSCGSESLNSKLFQTLLEFLHEARYYTSQEEAESMVENAMDLLSDLRSSNHMFAVHMLVLCLPTAYANYDKWVAIWLEKLASVTLNDGWDACWLTLLCRARKYTADPAAWTQKALPQLLAKATELLDPFAANSSAHPHVFPSYFAVMKVSPLDSRKTALKKVVKLLYLTLHQGPLLASLPPITITPPAQAKDQVVPGMTSPGISVHAGLEPLIAFLQTIRPLLYPSNVTSRTPDLGYFLSCITTELAQHLGQALLRQDAFAPLFKQCEASSSTVQAHFNNNSRDSLVVAGTLHGPTARYLAGVMCTISLEGLYAKSPFMVQCCTFSLRSLCAIEPSLGDVIMPFMLSSLHPDAANQSHMAPCSLNAMAYLFKPLLFPQPVLLPYLGDLLNMSLAGIDANDSKKTTTTLNMYIYLFGWIPESYVQHAAASSERQGGTLPGNNYLSIATGGDLGSSRAQENYKEFHSTLNPIVSEWAPLFVDKLFSLLKVKEQLKNSDGKIPPSPLGPYIGEAFDIVVSVLGAEMRLCVAKQVLDFALDGSNATVAATAAKELAKMMESLTGYDDSEGTLLRLLLGRLTDSARMDPTITSPEKLVLHLRLIGGCFRQAKGSNITKVAESVTFCFSDVYKHHTDKDVRKAVAKLLKDILKGLTSFYPLNEVEGRLGQDGLVVGCPQYSTVIAKVAWHVPSEEGVAIAAHLLEQHVTATMNEIEGLFALPTAEESESESVSLSVKQKEERLLTLLDLLQRGLRGVAELLGDGNNSGTRGRKVAVLSTGRDEVLSLLPEETNRYLWGLRDSVVEFLNRLHLVLDDDVSSGEGCMDVDSSSTATSTANGGSAVSFAGVVGNTPKVREICMRLFQIVVTQRMGCMKNIHSIKKWHGMTRRVKKSALTHYMEKKLGRLYFHLSEGNVAPAPHTKDVTLSSLEYWLGHDITQRSVYERAFIQHVLRQRELSFQSTYAAISDKVSDAASGGSAGGDNRLLLALHNLANMNGHEYDAVRTTAYGMFSNVSQRFGQGLEAVISPLIETIRTPGVTFFAASGALNIFHLDLVMKRITGNFQLCLQFLAAVQAFPSMVVSIEEADKRERLSDKLSSVFSKYLMAWHHSPLRSNDSTRQMVVSLIESILSDFGVDTNTSSVQTAKGNGIGNGKGSVAEGGGLRHELYLTSSVIHFIGHEDIQAVLPDAVWSWLMTSLRTKTGTPMQSLALAALTKLSLVQRSSPHAPATPFIANLLAETFTSGTSVSIKDMDQTSSNVQFLLGVSHGHTAPGGSAQWSQGVDQMLRNGEYMRNVVPRQESCSSDVQMFSKLFHISNAALFMHTMALALTNTLTVNLDAMVKDLIAACLLVPATSDEEARAVNATKAELFAGLCRLMVSLEFPGSTVSVSVPQEVLQSSWNLVKDFLLDNINKISLDYCNDWAEALAYGFGEYPQAVGGLDGNVVSGSSNIICTTVLDLAAQSFQNTCDEGSSSLLESARGGGGSGGFTRDTKHIVLLVALMAADVGAVASVTLARYNIKTATSTRTATNDMTKMETKATFSSTSQVVSKVLQFLLDLPVEGGSVFASPYLLLRQGLSKVLNLITDAELQTTPALTVLCERVINECQNAYQDIQSVVLTTAVSSSTTVVATATTDNSDSLVTLTTDSTTTAATVTNDVWKNACDCSTQWLASLNHNKQSWRYSAITEPLLKVALEGCAHSDITFSKQCHNGCKVFSQRVRVGLRGPTGGANDDPDFLSRVLAAYVSQSEHPSLHIRETVMICLTSLLMNNTASMTVEEKKLCKDVFAKGMLDRKPEVQVLSRKGMVTYLITKPISDLTTLAASYIKNCDILATREKKKKKLQKQQTAASGSPASSEKPDDIYITTIAMSSCMVLAFPFDLPPYIPALLTALVRHVSNPNMKDLITKTVQDFKSTHQDRWEEFKERFSREQLEDIQGAGAAHYFS